MKITVFMGGKSVRLSRDNEVWIDKEGRTYTDSTMLAYLKSGHVEPNGILMGSYRTSWEAFNRICSSQAPGITVGLTTYGRLAKEINARLNHSGNHDEPVLLDLVDKHDITFYYPDLTDERVKVVMQEIHHLYNTEQGTGLSRGIIDQAYNILTPDQLVGLIVTYQDKKWFTVMNTPDYVTLMAVGNHSLSQDIEVNDFTEYYNNGIIVEIKL